MVQQLRIDATDTYCTRFTPSKPSSIWNVINISKFQQLQEQGRMRPLGVAAFSRRTEAKSTVYAHKQATTAELPRAELNVFKTNRAAWTFFEPARAGDKKPLFHGINTAKRSETRVLRFAKFLDIGGTTRCLRQGTQSFSTPQYWQSNHLRKGGIRG